jgi:hypothetical protein
VVLRLLQKFARMENMDPEITARHNVTATNCSANGVRVRLYED